MSLLVLDRHYGFGSIIKKQIKSNEESFHNWILWNEKHLFANPPKDPQNLISTLRSMPKLNAVGSYYLLKTHHPELSDETLDGYLQNAFIADEHMVY